MTETNPHFEPVDSWTDARDRIDFEPRVPSFTADCRRRSLSIHVVDHRRRRLPQRERSLEAHYDRFVIDQKRASSPLAATRLATETSYGPDPQRITVGRCEGRSYRIGPEVDPDDVDGRSPAVVVWSDGDLVCLVASTELDADALLRIADSM